MDFPHLDFRLVRAGIAFALAALAAAARAAETGFIGALSAEERAECGIAKLSGPQVAALNALVERDVTLARQGGVTGFSSSFVARHSAKDRDAAGITRLSDMERSMLDVLTARAIAMGPAPEQVFAYAPAPAPPPPAETLVSAPPHLEVHGDVSFTVGGGSHGSSFYGTSADVFVTDPSGKFTLGVGVSEFRGKGFFGPWCPMLPLYAGPPVPDP
jgi:hypothetical protein